MNIIIYTIQAAVSGVKQLIEQHQITSVFIYMLRLSL